MALNVQFLYSGNSGNKAQEPSIVCHWKVVIANQLKRSSASSAHVQTAAPRFSVASPLVPLQVLPSQPSLSSSHCPRLILVCCLHTQPLMSMHTLICLSDKLPRELDLSVFTFAFYSASFNILYVSSTSYRYFSAASVWFSCFH